MIDANPLIPIANLGVFANGIDSDTINQDSDATLPRHDESKRCSVNPSGIDSNPSPYEPPINGMAEVCLYRKRTINLLRRYGKLSVETGRLPSVLSGMEFQRKITSYPLQTFEDAVIFVFDVERCLGELGEYEYEVIARVILRGENPDRAAYEMHCASRSVYRTLPEALDKLSKKFLRRGILSRSTISPKSCQGGKNGVFDLSS
jgi:hypothetical protein